MMIIGEWGTEMNAQQRRDEIILLLKSAGTPISASTLATSLNVSRQVIVGDIALLRAAGLDISATPRGYLLEELNAASRFGYEGIVACKHTPEQLKEELYTVVDFGGTLIDVTIEHSLYGQISGSLDISSRHEADLFCEKTSCETSQLLSKLTRGIHLHRIGCKDKQTFTLIKQALEEKNIAFS